MFAFLYIKAHSKEICKEISFPSFLRKMLMSAFLFRSKANYVEEMRGYPHFSTWIRIGFAKIYSFRMVRPDLVQKPWYLPSTVLKSGVQKNV